MTSEQAEPSRRVPAGRWAGWVFLSLFALFGGLLRDMNDTRLGPHVAEQIRTWQWLYPVGFAGFAILLFVFRRSPPRAATLLLGAVALRLPLLMALPNSDCYRYIWEGRLQRHGLNPYVYAPDDPRLVPLRDDVYLHINHKDYPAIYPPLSLLACRLFATIWYDVKCPQIAYAVIDIACVWALIRLLQYLKRPLWYAAIYALNPIVLAAFAHSGHNDPLMLLLLLFAVWTGAAHHWKTAGFFFGLAVLSKTPALILLALLPRRSWQSLVIAMVTIVAGYSIFTSAGGLSLGSLVSTPSQIVFNNFFDALRVWLRELGVPMIHLRQRNLIAAAALATIAAFHSLRPGDLLKDARRLLALAVLFNPITQFWYFSWPLLFIAMEPAGWFAWIVLCGTNVFYWQADWAGNVGLPWEQPFWAACAIWIPFYAAWILEWMVFRGRAVHAQMPGRRGTA